MSFVQGCVEANDVAPAKTSAIRFAVEADTGVRVVATRTVAQQVNIAEPLFVGFDGGQAVVTYATATQPERGFALTLDADSLELLVRVDRTYPRRANGQRPAHQSSAHAAVSLRDGRTLNVWTDDATGHVLADVDGSMPATIWTGDAVGAPHAVTSDGQRVVVAFSTSAENGFDLVAISLEAR
ncbi:MAG TPA: hypothetical protein VIF62_16180 [Labilithrix sp.]